MQIAIIQTFLEIQQCLEFPLFFSKRKQVNFSYKLSFFSRNTQNSKGVTFSKQIEKQRFSSAFSLPQKGQK
jgi:hypothetical protein